LFSLVDSSSRRRRRSNARVALGDYSAEKVRTHW
jgi:hypothetical protein